MIDLRIETELGELPASWQVGPLGEFLSKAQYGASVKGAASGGCPILRMTNQVNGRISPANLQYADISTRELESFRVQRGDILFNRTNSFELVGRTAIFDLDGDYVFASYLIRLRTLEAVLDPFFLNAYLNAHGTQRRLKGIATRAVSQSNISASRLRTFVVPVPPIAEQRKIAGVLEVVQRALEQQERLLTLTTELKKALLHKLFTQGLRGEPQKQTEIGPVPESWEVVPIGSLGKVVTGSTPKTKVPEYYAPHEVDLIAPADLGNTKGIYDSEKRISRAGLASIRPLPTDAVMCVCIGSSIGKVGMTTKSQSATNQQINSIICHSRHDPDFVYYLLSFLSSYWRGFATFGPVPILSKGAFEVIKIATPRTREEEHEIATILRACDAKMEVHQLKDATFTALFRTLLHQLMTAHIRVNDLDLSELAAQAEET